MIEEFRFTEDLKQNLVNNALVLHDNIIFTGTEMYQGLKKQTEFKDHTHYQFEMQRVKTFEAFRKHQFGSVVYGPQLDLFGSYLSFVSLNADKDQRRSSNLVGGKSTFVKMLATSNTVVRNQTLHILPVFQNNELDLLPRDDFINDRVAFSTFTLHQDDILMMLSTQKFVVFKLKGSPLKIKLCPDSE